MPTIIDALITTITLEDSGYQKGAKRVDQANKDLKDSISALEEQIATARRKSTKETSAQDQKQIKGLQEVLRQKKKSLADNTSAEKDQLKRSKDQTQTLDKLKVAALELFAVFTAGVGIKAFVIDIVAGDAAMGRMAANLGESAQTATAFGAVIAGLGGKAEEGVAALQNLAAMRFAMQAKGDYSAAPGLSALGVKPSDLNNLDGALSKLAATAQKMPKAEFYQRLSALGFSAGAINALELGNVELAKQIELAKQRERLTDSSIAKDQASIQSLAALTDAAKGVGRDLAGMIPAGLPALITNLATNHLPAIRGALLGVAAAAAILTFVLAPEVAGVVGFVAIIAGVGAALGELVAHFHEVVEGAQDMWYALTHHGQKRPTPGPHGATGSWGSPSTTGSASGLQQQRAVFAVDYLKSQGISDPAARGAVAGAIAEAKLDPNAVNPKSGAFGIGQWLGPRKAALMAQFGSSPTFDQQLQFLAQELKGGDRGGAAVLGANSAQDAMQAYVRGFMRPGVGAAGDLSRGRQALAGLGFGIDPGILAGAGAAVANSSSDNSRSTSINSDVQIGKIEVHVPAGADGQRIGTDVADRVKTQSFVAMANAGLA